MPMQWRTIKQPDGPTERAVAFATARSWIEVDDMRGIALTDAGRQIAEDLGKPLH